MAKVSEKNLMKYEMAMNYAIARIRKDPEKFTKETGMDGESAIDSLFSGHSVMRSMAIADVGEKIDGKE